MKKAAYHAPAILVAATLPMLARAAPLDLPSAPVAVTVYDDRASVTRLGTIDIPAGDSELVLHDLPLGVLRDTVAATATASAAVTLGAVETREETIDPATRDDQRSRLAARLRDLGDRIAAIDVRVASFGAQQDFIRRLVGGAAGSSLIAAPERWKLASNTIRDSVSEAGEGQRRAAHDRADLVAERDRLQAELDRLGPPESRALAAVVAVHADRAARLDLRLAYQVPDAHWYPLYEARLQTVGTPTLRLRQDAIVVQSTGEDWSDVALTLATARPSRGTAEPEVSPWSIDLAPLTPSSGGEMYSVSSASSPAPMPFASRKVSPAMEEAAVAASRVSQTGLAVEYVVANRSTVASDGSERRVRIGDLPAQETLLTAVAVPRQETSAYLEATLVDAAPTPLMPGAVALFLDGSFVGRADLPLVRPHDHAALSFGVDDRIAVDYRPQGKLASRDGIIWGKKAVVSSAALIVVANHHDQPIAVRVVDQAPVSTDAALKVEITADPAPSRSAVDDKPGVVAWEATYQPGETRQIHFGYAVSAPEGRRVIGLR